MGLSKFGIILRSLFMQCRARQTPFSWNEKYYVMNLTCCPAIHTHTHTARTRTRSSRWRCPLNIWWKTAGARIVFRYYINDVGRIILLLISRNWNSLMSTFQLREVSTSVSTCYAKGILKISISPSLWKLTNFFPLLIYFRGLKF